MIWVSFFFFPFFLSLGSVIFFFFGFRFLGTRGEKKLHRVTGIGPTNSVKNIE